MRRIVMDAEMPIFCGGSKMKVDLPCVLVLDAPDDLLLALHTGRRPGVASIAAAVPRPPVRGAAAIDGAAGPGRLGEVAAGADRTNDDGAGVRPDAVPTA